ncbi:MAG: glucuronate isomerase, partial [Victivallales bacterium]|nr:glucuronate isomerase [Victivallales bacterium]
TEDNALGLLTTELSRKIYGAVKGLPIIDFHNHLPVKDIVGNRQYHDLTELWVASDPYKHRAMRICGVREALITGDASPKEKFLAWAQTAPKQLGNPLWHWTRLELLRVFGIEEELTPDTAESIWRRTSEMLATPEYRTLPILERFNIEYAAPCCTIQDSLEPFKEFLIDKRFRLVPSLRGDDMLSPTQEMLKQLSSRLDDFHGAGCRIADHALDAGFRYQPDAGNDKDILADCKPGISTASAMLRLLGQEYARRGWILQLHIGALRQTSERLRREAGPAGGYAGIGHSCDIASISALLNDLERLPFGLPRTILYTLNPVDHAALAVLAGSFPGDGVRGNVQLGPAWWLCDHIHGMRDCLEVTAAYGVLSVFNGMTTDSRSILSFVRHEYFRRVLSAWLASKVSSGEMPDDFDRLAQLAREICHENAKTVLQL